MSAALYSEFFRSKNLAEIAWYGTTEATSRIAKVLLKEKRISNSEPLRELCDLVYGELLGSSRPEYIYKNLLLSKTVFGKYSPATTSWLYEFKVGEARADAVLVNGDATVFEIKTDLDDFSRAEKQVESYYKCFDRVVFVVSEKQKDKALRLLSPSVGILGLSKRDRLATVRNAKSFRKELSSASIFHLFRKKERDILEEKYKIDTRSVPPIQRYRAALDAVSDQPAQTIYSDFVAALRARAPAEKRASIAAQLPKSLRAAVFGYNLKDSEWQLLASRLQEPIREFL